MSGYQIPPGIYARVQEAVLTILNASLVGDDILFAASYEQFREFCEQQNIEGRNSGFMWEALADVTHNEVESLLYYERSLAWARRNSKPTHTVLLELGKIYADAGDGQRAGPLLCEAREQAIACSDSDTEREAVSVLLLSSPQ